MVGAIVIALPAPRESLLRTAGWALVVSQPIEPVEIIVVATDANGPGVLEAADLVHRGIASRVGVFADPPGRVDREFLRRGVPYEDEAARLTRQLRSLGVTRIEQIPRSDAGTQAEADVLPAWCEERQVRSVLVVTTTDHSRRMQRVLRRAMSGYPTKVMVRPARYSDFDPDRWWESRGGLRTGIIELQKLLLDVLRHPLS
jgi:hypothetical protein